MKKKGSVFLGLAIFVFLVGEIVGRYYGLCSYPTFVADPDFEYISAPNLDTHIYGKHFVTNQYSQRSGPVNKSDTLIYLLIGDSVVFGGNEIDQDSLATTLAEDELKKSGRPVRILNISSKTWGPDNGAAYIKKYGTFGAKKIMLILSSHDAYDNITHEPIVGKPSHPDHNAPSAWVKIIEKGWPVIARRFGTVSNDERPSAAKPGTPFNSGFDAFRMITDSLRIPLIIYLHKTTNEMQVGHLLAAGEDIKQYCEKYDLRLVEGAETPDMYLDYIHFNTRGQRFLSRQIIAALR